MGAACLREKYAQYGLRSPIPEGNLWLIREKPGFSRANSGIYRRKNMCPNRPFWMADLFRNGLEDAGSGKTAVLGQEQDIVCSRNKQIGTGFHREASSCFTR